ncbi:MAG: FGGY family carbohydrate kinase [Hyphomicrobiaceae bacterium]
MPILAIDQGTTSTKSFLLHEDGRFETLGSRRHQQFHPAEGHVEHDASELIRNIETLIDEALAEEPAIAGIALANQGETVVAWNRRTGEPLHHAIVWQDQRTQAWLDELAPSDRSEITRIGGLPVDAYFSASKLTWLLEHVPSARHLAETARSSLGLATSDAYFIDRLTGAYRTDVSTASRTSLMSLTGCGWSPELCRVFALAPEQLPVIVSTTGPFGIVRRKGRELPLLASIVDQQAALFGHGCRKPGDLKITFGTGTFALAVTGTKPRMDAAGLVPTVAWQLGAEDPVYALDGGDYTAAAAVEWAKGLGLASAIEDFAFGDGPSALERGLVFVPALAGLAAPYWDRNAAGAFLGLRLATTSADLRQAILEGIALRASELVQALAPEATADIFVDGGLTSNRGFVQFLADVLGRSVVLQATSELTGLGAAELAYVALGGPVPPRPRGQHSRIEPSARSAAIRARTSTFPAAIGAVRSWMEISSGEDPSP